MASLYTTLVAKLIFPLHERLKRHTTVADRDHMEKVQWWSRDDIEALQVERLRSLLVHAKSQVPYYQRLFSEHGFSPESVKRIDDLQQLPFLTKAEIREHSDDLKANNAVGIARFNTGGSSGAPLIFYIGRRRVSHDVAAKWRATRWWGVDIGDPEIVVWGSPIELGSQDRVRAIRDKLLRTRLLSAFEISDSKLDQFVEEIKQVRPKMLFGYPSALSLIARHAECRGVDMSQLGIKVAFVTSERLYDEQRADIERVFGCPVANGYGGRDAGFIAHQCPQGGMHITADDIIVELIDQEGRPVADGMPGEIVVTHLATHDYPFIRYRTGDIAVMSTDTCACGRGLPMLQEIQGRATDFIRAADGTMMHGLALIYVLRDVESVETFKIIQESKTLLRVLLVANADFSDTDNMTILSGLQKRMGEGVDVVIERVDEIPAEKSGKFRFVVNKIT
ncbi:MAG TPA: phenylacetate--CoA ligase family protein [Chromatiaceae bacterium]|nr:phenylacetate--CoA ligase family protein [Chromatiaceae bacterium]